MTDYSYQLYCSRNAGPLPATLKMLAEIGYKRVEGFGGVLGDAQALAADLKANGLTMPSTHIGLDAVEKDPKGVIAKAKLLGISQVIVPHVMPDQRPTDAAGWTAFGARLAKAGAPIEAAGLTFGWHNHDFEFKALPDGSYPIDCMLKGAPKMGLELDIAWVARAGEDPVAWINKLKDRLIGTHVKDIAPKGQCVDEDGWADVGHGTMDWKAINTALKGAKLAVQVVEHDKPKDDKRFARRSLAAAKAF